MATGQLKDSNPESQLTVMF